jgi:transforming growth factor-beta-induced protein
MSRLTKSVVILALALLLIVPIAGAAGHQTIVEIAVEDGRFTTLVAAVVAADLADTLSGGEWTVFAPTDDAFAKLGLNAGNVASAFSKAELTDILLYHVLSGDIHSDKAKSLVGDIVMANNELAGLKYYDGSLYVNDESKVIIPDINASNGVVHVVDTVILGPWPRTDDDMPAVGGAADAAAGNTIVDIAVSDGRFETLVAAVVYAGLAETLSGGEWTVFAPTDDAFAKLGLNANNITSAFSKAELTDILLYHVLSGEVHSDKALTLLGDVTMANDKLAGLKAFDGSLFVNDDSKVIIPDINADNGVIHVVDTVILGPWPREAE